jgi:hypothetical protein
VVLPALLLVLLLAALDLWAAHHFGIGIRDPGALALFLSVAGAAWGVVGWFFNREERAAAENRVRETLRPLVLTPTLVLVGWAAFLVSTLLFSSITVVAEPGVPMSGVVVAAPGDTAGRRAVDAGARQIRVPVLTSPLAGAYTVRADGYLPTAVEALPVVGARVRLGRDVARSPSMLIRPVGPLLDALRLAGEVRVVRREEGRERELARSAAGESGSFVIGHARPAVRERLADWERELRVAGVRDEVGLSRHLLEWQKVHALPVDGDLGPGDTLVVRVVSRVGRPMAEAEVVLRAVELEDLFLRSNR